MYRAVCTDFFLADVFPFVFVVAQFFFLGTKAYLLSHNLALNLSFAYTFCIIITSCSKQLQTQTELIDVWRSFRGVTAHTQLHTHTHKRMHDPIQNRQRIKKNKNKTNKQPDKRIQIK